MYCKNCGKLLGEGDKFCSNCGTKAEEEFVPDFKKRREEIPQETKEDRPKKSFHIEEFNWDLEGYPTDKKKTEDVDFNWESVLDDRQKSRRGEEPARMPEQDKTSTAQPPAEEAFSGFAEAAQAGANEAGTEAADRADKIDKFYTFNRKNEAFQALLDQEYEKIKNGGDEGSDSEEEDADPAAVRVEDICSSAAETDEPPEDGCIEVVLAATPDGIVVERTSLAEMPAYSESERNYPPSGQNKEEKERDKEREQQNRLTFDDVFGHDDVDETPKKKNKVLKVIAVILCVLIVLELIVIGIQYFAPDSAAGKLINDTYGRILELFAGEEEEAAPAAAVDDSSVLGPIIDAQKDKNKNIAAIDEDAQLTFENGKDYGFDGFADSHAFGNESWYTGDDGETITYGEEIIGTLIGYYSAWVDKMNGSGDAILDYIDDTSALYTEMSGLEPQADVKYGINRLSIGEIRSASAGFYVLVSVDLVDSESSEEKTEKQIVYMEPEEKAMKIVSIKKI